MQESIPKIEEREVKREFDTLKFLRSNGVEPLSLGGWKPGQSLSFSNWKPGQPILFVFQDFMDTSGDTPTGPRPSIARVDSPVSMKFKEGSESVILLENHGGQVDYFAIDARSERVIYVRSSRKMRGANHPYVVMLDNIFQSSDELFPKRPGVVKT